jgi:hypothetical protein
VTGTGGGDTGLSNPLYWAAGYVYGPGGKSWSASMPYPSKRHTTYMNAVNRTYSLSYTHPTYVDFWFGTLNGSDCTLVSWAGLLKY